MNRLSTVASHLGDDGLVRRQRHGSVLMLILLHTNSPLSCWGALTGQVRRLLLKGLRAALLDDSCKAILLTSDDERIFSCGLSMESFADGIVDDNVQHIPSLAKLTAEVESCSKPIAVLIRGLCYSWGLELALAATYRLCTSSACFSFPDVLYGLVPCGGGSQRLTRLVGAPMAIAMLCTARKVDASEAQRTGLVHHVISDEDAVNPTREVEVALRMLEEWTSRPRPSSPSQVKQRIGLSMWNKVLFMSADHHIRDSAPRSVKAPYHSLQAVRIATQHTTDFDRGVESEQELFRRSLELPEAKAMQNLARASLMSAWTGESGVSAVRRSPSTWCPRCVAVVGDVSMVTVITLPLLQRGHHVILVEPDEGRRKDTWMVLKAAMDREVCQGRLSHRERERASQKLSMAGGTDSLDPLGLGGADVVVFCSSEHTRENRGLMAQLNAMCKRSCVFITTFCTGRLVELAKAVGRPSRVVTMHLPLPSKNIQLAEVGHSSDTSMEALWCAVQLAQSVSKHVVVARDSFGLISTRVFLSGLYQAYALIQEGCFPIEVDLILKRRLHLSHGIFELNDVIGLDVTQEWYLRAPTMLHRHFRADVLSVANHLVEGKHFGRKTGEGWYCYSKPNEAAPQASSRCESSVTDSPLWNSPVAWDELQLRHKRRVEHLIRAHCNKRNILRRDITETEVVERVLLAMVNEAASILAEGVARSAAEVDLASVYGVGFADWKGGLCYYADHALGAETILARMRVNHFALGSEAFPPPCETLVQMEREQATFAGKFPPRSIC